MSLPRVILFFAACLFIPFAVADVGVGDTREQVLREVGNPTSRARRGDREIFLYPHGGRIEFIEGKVVDVKGPLPKPAPEPAATSAAAATATTAATPATVAVPPTPAPANPPAVKATAAKPAPAGVASPGGSAHPTDALGKHIEKMNTAWGEQPAVEPQPTAVPWLKLLVDLALHFGITVLALKIAFKFWEMDAFWSGVLAIAGIDLAVFGGLELLGPVTGGISTMGGVQSGLGAVVMIFTIRKFCFNKRVQDAVLTAMCVKLVVTLCHVFLFVLLLNAMFG